MQPAVLAICYVTPPIGNGQPSRSNSMGERVGVWAYRFEPQLTSYPVRSMPLARCPVLCRLFSAPREPFGAWIASTAAPREWHGHLVPAFDLFCLRQTVRAVLQLPLLLLPAVLHCYRIRLVHFVKVVWGVKVRTEF